MVESKTDRWETLKELDAWLQKPMLVLSFAWLVLVIVELTHGTSSLNGNGRGIV